MKKQVIIVLSLLTVHTGLFSVPDFRSVQKDLNKIVEKASFDSREAKNKVSTLSENLGGTMAFSQLLEKTGMTQEEMERYIYKTALDMVVQEL